jgi:predicted enzyme related to lactoylglutathione lyase
MKTDFLGLRTTIYKVSDIDKAKDWYTNVLNIKPYFDEPFYAGFNVAGFELGLQPQENKDEQNSGGVISYWGVDDVKGKYKELLALGASSYEEPAEVGGGIVVATVKDPWNNLLGIIYNPHFTLAEAGLEQEIKENSK